LTLPSEDYLAELVDEIDVEAIHAAREFTRRTVAQVLEARLVDAYCSRVSPNGAGYDPKSAARRRLRDLCLAYLNLLDKEEYTQWALDQLSAARNMTDTMGALCAVNDRDTVQRARALEAFHDAYHDNALVMDKWFGLQAESSLPRTLGTVKHLLNHPLFSIRNPNRVRALIGSFVQRNAINFHDISGEGYRFLTEQVLQIDPLNPQMAARLVKSFTRWRKYDVKRRTLMRAELERIAASQGLSKDVYEIASKSLA
jgi:aminopeptidase N